MDDDQLDRMLANLKAPEPSEKAQDQAFKAAMAAFEEKNTKPAQGGQAQGRLTGIINDVRRKIMNKKHVASGLAGGVALCALVGVLGMPFFEEQMKTMVRGEGAVPQPAAASAILQSNRADGAPAGATREIMADSGSDNARAMDSLQAPMPVRPAEPVTAPAAVAERKAEFSGAPAAAPAGAPQTQRAMMSESMIAPAPPGFMPPPDYIAPVYQDQGRDKFKDFEESAVKTVQAEPVSTFSIDVDTASYAFLRRMINQGQLPGPDAVRVEEMVNYFDYDYALPESKDQPFAPTVAVYDSPWNAHKKIIHVGIKGYEVEEKPKSNLVFLIDTSGSMNSPDKLPLLRNSFKMMLDSLNPDDTVAIVTYAGSAGTALEPTRASDKAKIIAALEQMSAGGSTAGEAGIRQAYALAEQNKVEGGNNRIILATDGDFNVGASSPDELKAYVEGKRRNGVFLSVIGFGQGNYNDHMMQELAQNGNGNAAYIDNLNEARKVLVEEANSTLFTIAKDVKIQVEFNPAAVSEYRLVGYETRKLNREDFNNDKVDAGEVGAGASVTAIYEITPVGAPKMVDDLRYGASEKAQPEVKPQGSVDEYAFLKIRYKKPDSDTSKLMERAITAGDAVDFDKASDDIRFANAVAGFGQLVKGGNYTGSLTYDDIVAQATAARGKDEFGYRTEFANLVRLAKGLKQ